MLNVFIDFFLIAVVAASFSRGFDTGEVACPQRDDADPTCDPALRHVMETVTLMELDAPKKEDIQLQLLQTHRAKVHATSEQDAEKPTKFDTFAEHSPMSAEHGKDEFSHFSSREHGIGLQLASSVVEENFGPQAGLESWGDADSNNQKAVVHSMHHPTSQIVEAVPAADGWDGNASLSVASGMMVEIPTQSEGSVTLDVLRQFMVVIVGIFLALSRFCWFPSPFMRCRKRSASPAVPALVRSAACAYAEKFRVASVSDVEHRIAELRDGDDANPPTSGRPMRIQVRIEGLADGSTLLTPLTQRACAIYSAAASCENEKGPGLVAFMAKAPDFVVSVVGAPLLQIEVKGEDVSLFDMFAGKWFHHEPLISAPEQMQDFVLTHMDMAPESECQAICALREAPSMAFHETALLVGTVVTMVGELCRTPQGRLRLRPVIDASSEDLRLEQWRSPAWFREDIDEMSDCGAGISNQSASDDVSKTKPSQKPPMLLVSDSPELLSTLPRIGGPAKTSDTKPQAKACGAKSLSKAADGK